jgi:biopolymer transport protein ExbD
MPIQKARFKISDYNEKRKLRLGKHDRRMRMVSLSLTSMVDMFAILVIFLLSSSSTVSQWIEVAHNIDLPKAKATDIPQKVATLQISSEAIFGDERRLISVREVLAGGPTVHAVREWLSHQKKSKEGYVNIVADQKVPYPVIKKLITSCQEAGFSNVNLAVQPRGSG